MPAKTALRNRSISTTRPASRRTGAGTPRGLRCVQHVHPPYVTPDKLETDVRTIVKASTGTMTLATNDAPRKHDATPSIGSGGGTGPGPLPILSHPVHVWLDLRVIVSEIRYAITLYRSQSLLDEVDGLRGTTLHGLEDGLSLLRWG